MNEVDGRLKATNINIEFEEPPYKPKEKKIENLSSSYYTSENLVVANRFPIICLATV